MARRRQNTAYFIVLAAAAGALVVDRFVLGGGTPSSAEAAAMPAHSVASDGGAENPAAAAKPAKTQVEELRSGPLASRLDELAASDSVAGLLQPRPIAQPLAAATSTAQVKPEPAAAPVIPELNVTSIMISDRGRRAIVNRTVMVVGESLDGARLLEINTDGLVFEVAGTHVEVALRRD